MHKGTELPTSGGSHHEVVCIEAKRICDFCFQEHRVERTFHNIPTPPHGAAVDCEIETNEIVCREVERRILDSKDHKVLVCVAIEVPVTIRVGAERIRHTIVFLKQAIIAAPLGTEIECQVTGNCCCFFDRETKLVTCTFDFCVVIQSKVTVRILVPTLGACVPKPCKAVVNCPPIAPVDCAGDFCFHSRDDD